MNSLPLEGTIYEQVRKAIYQDNKEVCWIHDLYY